MAKKNNSELFASLLYILIGVLLVIFKSETIGWAMTIAGIFFIVSGALDLIKQNWAEDLGGNGSSHPARQMCQGR